MASKLNKSDYEKALSAEYGFPVFLSDKEFERLSVSKPNPVRPAEPYKDPFDHMDRSRPGYWGTKQGTSYNKDNGRAGAKLTAAHTAKREPVLAGVPSSVTPKTSGPEAPSSGAIGKIQPYEPPGISAEDKASLAQHPSFVAGAEWLGGDEPVEDLGGDDRPNTLEQKVADQEKAALLAVPGQIATLPQTYKQGYVPTAPAMPQWQSDEDEWEAMSRRYAMLSGGK